MSRTVLIVEDDADTRTLLATILAAEGYCVVEADNGREALALLRCLPAPCVALVDVTMPIMDGLTLVEAIRADDTLRTVPVILCTGVAASQFSGRADVQGVLSKPVAVQDLLALLLGAFAWYAHVASA